MASGNFYSLVMIQNILFVNFANTKSSQNKKKNDWTKLTDLFEIRSIYIYTDFPQRNVIQIFVTVFIRFSKNVYFFIYIMVDVCNEIFCSRNVRILLKKITSMNLYSGIFEPLCYLVIIFTHGVYTYKKSDATFQIFLLCSLLRNCIHC